MQIIYEQETRKIICWWDEANEGNVVPTTDVGQARTTLDCTMEEFEEACRESAGDWEGIGVGENYLHDAPSQAEASAQTTGRGVRIGHMAVECEHKDNHIPQNTPLAEVITKIRQRRGKAANEPVTLAELQEAEEARHTMRLPVVQERLQGRS